MDKLVQAVSDNRSLWIELECAEHRFVIPPTVQPVTDPLHCTLLFMGKGLEALHVQRIVTSIEAVARVIPSLKSRVGGHARFRGSDREGDPAVVLLSDIRIRDLRTTVRSEIRHAGTPVREDDWDYTPHVTLGRVSHSATLELEAIVGGVVEFNSIAVCAGEERVSYPLEGKP